MKPCIPAVLSTWALLACNPDHTSGKKKLDDSTVWIFDPSGLPDGLRNFTENYMTTDSANMYFNGQLFGEIRFSSDTFRIIEICSTDLGTDSFQRRESLAMEGIITKHNHDTLVIKRLRGYIPIKKSDEIHHETKSETWLFLNEELFRKNDQGLTLLSFSNSTCYGNCPAIAFELNSHGDIKYYGGSHAKKQGYYTGRVSNSCLNKINDCLAYLNLEKDSNYYPTPLDAPSNEIYIRTKHKESYFTGCGSNYPNKLRQLYRILLETPENSKISPSTDTFNFKNHLENPPLPLREITKFIPPEIH